MAAQAVTLGIEGLTIEDLYAVAVEHATLRIDPSVRSLVEASRAVVERALHGDRLIYGLNTRLGHLRDERVPLQVLLEHQREVVMAHAGGIGTPLPDAEVRALLIARLAGMARGGSGIHPTSFELLVELLNRNVTPSVPEIGSVGASDLAPLAAVALIAIGQGQARYAGEALPGGLALARAGLSPVTLQPKDALTLISANSVSIGLGALTVREAERIAALADLAGALTVEALGGNLGPFEVQAAAAKPVPGQIAAAAHLRALLSGSYIYDPKTRLSVQDPLSVRTMPQVHGALRERVGACRGSVTLELNAIDDNPLVSIADDTLLSNGNFFPMVMALDFDALRLALAHVGMIAERRAQKLGERAFSHPQPGSQGWDELPPLAGLLCYSAAAMVAQLKHLAAPVTLLCPPLDKDMEDHTTLAPFAVSTARQSIRCLETILLIEMVLAADALLSSPEARDLGVGTGSAVALIGTARRRLGATASAAQVVEAARSALRDATG